MSIMVEFQRHGYGTLSPSTAERQEVLAQLQSAGRLRAIGMLRTLQPDAAKALGVANPAAAASAAGVREPSADLDRDMFLRLLLQQIQNQDPLEPVSNTDMLAQLAQFTALEQMNNLNDRFDGLRDEMSALTGNVDQLNFITAQGLLNRYVEGINEEGDPVTGRVTSVHLEGSIVILNVDGRRLPMTGVFGIGDAPPPEAGEDGKKGAV